MPEGSIPSGDSMEGKGLSYSRRRVAYVGGTFDLFHPGHVHLLEAVKYQGYYVVVALNTDEFNEEYKGFRPIMTLEERIEVVRACQYVDAVVVNTGGADSKPSILAVRPSVIAHGKDWTGDSLARQMGLSDEFMREHGIDFLYVELARYDDGSKISTSEIKRRVIEQHEE